MIIPPGLRMVSDYGGLASSVLNCIRCADGTVLRPAEQAFEGSFSTAF
jgi:hypothetical protein